MQKEPLVLTLLLDVSSHQYFTDLRNQYFPKHCNYLEAHLTLFHKLPKNKNIIGKILNTITQRPSMSLQVAAIKSMGNGVAFEIKSKELSDLHKSLQQKFSPFLIMQDRQKIWPHITIQNKVTAYKAKQTLELLQQDFKPFNIEGVGIGSWLYKGGPWEKQEEYLFISSKQ
ncbi:MAG: 2'-5' RNA ligase family protein [Sphingobacteriaceae bacterium]|nr:MAG: 2'-5' RNA ligase family protein [Sphingobacteriaceae bacterium]